MPNVTGDWKAWYASRTVTPEKAVSSVRPSDNVWISMGQESPALRAALLGTDMPVDVTMMVAGDLSWYTPEIAQGFRVNVLFASESSREPINDFRADYTPWWVWGAHKALDEGRPEARPLDVCMIRVTPPNTAGWCCLGNILWDAKTTAQRARTVIAEVNESIPRTFGDTWIHVTDIDWFVQAERHEPDPERAERIARYMSALAAQTPAESDLAIAEHVGGLVRDGETIQIGTGTTTAKLVRFGAFDGRNDLGYFAELTVPGTVGLAQKGVITGRYVTTHPGKFVTTMAGGLPDENAFINDNPGFEFYSVDYMHHPGAIARNDNLVAINNALSVDLTGQIAAGQIGRQVWSGTGGQLAYAMGAMLSKGGRSVTVLPSTARGGTVSRIVPQFQAGQVVSVPRDLADIVVTEHGVAHLLNKTQRQRAEALVEIAHPDYRAELRQEAKRLYGA